LLTPNLDLAGLGLDSRPIVGATKQQAAMMKMSSTGHDFGFKAADRRAIPTKMQKF